MSLDPYRVYKVAAAGEGQMHQIRLKNIEWSALFSMNGERSLHEIGRQLDLKPEEIDHIATRLLEHGLIEEESISFEQYLLNTGKGPAAQKTVTVDEFLSQGRNQSTPASSGIASTPNADQTRFNLPPLPQKPEPENSPAPRRPVLFLRALIDFIVSQSPSSTEGQLAVYRIFLRVPPELLKRNGIVSLSLVEEQSSVDDPELQAALARAVEQTLRLSLPASLFA